MRHLTCAFFAAIFLSVVASALFSDGFYHGVEASARNASPAVAVASACPIIF